MAAAEVHVEAICHIPIEMSPSTLVRCSEGLVLVALVLVALDLQCQGLVCTFVLVYMNIDVSLLYALCGQNFVCYLSE